MSQFDTVLNKLYNDVLKRDVDDYGKTIYKQKIVNGEITFDDLKNILIHSDEYKLKKIDNIKLLFEKVISRPVSTIELEKIFNNDIKNIKNLTYTTLKSTDEYIHIIDCIYNNFFNRLSSQNERQFIINSNTIINKADIYTIIKNSDEFKNQIVLYYNEIYNITPSINHIKDIIENKTINNNTTLKIYIENIKKTSIECQLYQKILNREITDEEYNILLCNTTRTTSDIISFIKESNEYITLHNKIIEYIKLIDENNILSIHNFNKEDVHFIHFIKKCPEYYNYKITKFMKNCCEYFKNTFDFNDIDLHCIENDILNIDSFNTYYEKYIIDIMQILKQNIPSFYDIYDFLYVYYENDVKKYKTYIYTLYMDLFNILCSHDDLIYHLINFIFDIINIENFTEYFYTSKEYKRYISETLEKNYVRYFKISIKYNIDVYESFYTFVKSELHNTYNSVIECLYNYNRFKNLLYIKINDIYIQYVHRKVKETEFNDIIKKCIENENYIDILRSNLFYSIEYFDIHIYNIKNTLHTYINDIIEYDNSIIDTLIHYENKIIHDYIDNTKELYTHYENYYIKNDDIAYYIKNSESIHNVDQDILRYCLENDTLYNIFLLWYNSIYENVYELKFIIKDITEYKLCIVEKDYTLLSIKNEILNNNENKTLFINYLSEFIDNIQCNDIIKENSIIHYYKNIFHYKNNCIHEIKQDILDNIQVRDKIYTYINNKYLDIYKRKIYDFEFYEIYTIHIDTYLKNSNTLLLKSDEYNRYCDTIIVDIFKKQNKYNNNINIDSFKNDIIKNKWTDDEIKKNILLYSFNFSIENILLYFLNIEFQNNFKIQDITKCLEYINKIYTIENIEVFFKKIKTEFDEACDYLHYTIHKSDYATFIIKFPINMDYHVHNNQSIDTMHVFNYVDFILYQLNYLDDLKLKIKKIYINILENAKINTKDIDNDNDYIIFIQNSISYIKKNICDMRDIYSYIKNSSFYKKKVIYELTRIYNKLNIQIDDAVLNIIKSDFEEIKLNKTNIKKCLYKIIYNSLFLKKINIKLNTIYVKLFNRDIRSDELSFYIDMMFNKLLILNNNENIYVHISVHINNIIYNSSILRLFQNNREYNIYNCIDFKNLIYTNNDHDIIINNYKSIISNIYRYYINCDDVDIHIYRYVSENMNIGDFISNIKMSDIFLEYFYNYIHTILDRNVTNDEKEFYYTIYSKSSLKFKEIILNHIDNKNIIDTLIVSYKNNFNHELELKNDSQLHSYKNYYIHDSNNTFDYEISIDNSIDSIQENIKKMYNRILNQQPSIHDLYTYIYDIFFNNIDYNDLQYTLKSCIYNTQIDKKKDISDSISIYNFEEYYKIAIQDIDTYKLCFFNNILYLFYNNCKLKVCSFHNLDKKINAISSENICSFHYIGDYIYNDKNDKNDKNDTIQLSLIIFHKNNPYTMIHCLKHILFYTHTIIFEIIIIDNNSVFDNYNILNNFCRDHSNIRLYRCKIDYSISEIYNIGIYISYGEYILFLNNNTFVSNDWCKPMLELINMNDISLSFCFFSGKLLNINATIDNMDNPTNEYIDIIDTHDMVDKVNYSSRYFLCIRRDILNSINGFTYNFNIVYLDEYMIELQYRLKKNGYKIKILPDFYMYTNSNYMRKKYNIDMYELHKHIIPHDLHKKYNKSILIEYNYSYKIDKYLIILLKIIENYNILGYCVDLITSYYISSNKILYYCSILDIKIDSVNIVYSDTYTRKDNLHNVYNVYILISDICDIKDIEDIKDIKCEKEIIYTNKKNRDKDIDISSLLCINNADQYTIRYFNSSYIVEYLNITKDMNIVNKNTTSILIICVITHDIIDIINDIVHIVTNSNYDTIEINMVLNFDYDMKDYIYALQNIKSNKVHIFHEIDVKTLYTLYMKCNVLIKFPLCNNKSYNSVHELYTIHKDFNIVCISDTIDNIIINNNIKIIPFKWCNIKENFIDFICNYKDGINRDIIDNSNIINYLI